MGVGDQGRFVGLCALAKHGKGGDRFAPDVVGQADDRDLGDGGMGGERVLDLARIDVVAAGHDHVRGPIDQGQIALRVEPADVAGPEPAAGKEGQSGQFGIGIAFHRKRRAKDDLAGLARRCRPRRPAGSRIRRSAARRRAAARGSRRHARPSGGRRWRAALRSGRNIGRRPAPRARAPAPAPVAASARRRRRSSRPRRDRRNRCRASGTAFAAWSGRG